RQVLHRQLEQAPGPSTVSRGPDGSSSTFRRTRYQKGSEPSGSTSPTGRARARTATTSPTASRMSSRPSTETSASWASTTRQRTTAVGPTTTDRVVVREPAIGGTTHIEAGGDRVDAEIPGGRAKDRPAGRERVAGRARRAGDHEPVGDERREVGAIDARVEPDDAGERAAGAQHDGARQ